jgi:hypothetical protein
LEIEEDVEFDIEPIKILAFRLSAGLPVVKDSPRFDIESSRNGFTQSLSFLLQKTRFNLAFHLSAASHIAPLRPIQPRVTIRNSQVPKSKSLRRNREKSEVAVNDYLRQLTNDRYEFERRSFEGGEYSFLGEVEVSVLRDKFLNVLVSFHDVGVGLSQVLPVLQALDSLSAERGDGLAIIEQPELHLHPKMQAQLTELMLETALRSGQIIAETHSEPMLLRIQRLLRQNSADGKPLPNVSVIYASFDSETGTKFENLPLRSDLDFMVHMPTSFSDLRFEELS